MKTIKLTTSSLVENIKQHASKVEKEFGISCREALNQAAKDFHFDHWDHVIEMATITAPTEEAFKDGLLIACDFSETNFEPEFFIEDHLALFFMQEEAEQKNSNMYDAEELENLIFFRYTGKDNPQNLEDALRAIRKDFFWCPRYVCLKGKVQDTFEEQTTDLDGNTAGLRVR